MEHLTNEKNYFPLAIIGGGHAGLEAAWISSQFADIKTAIITSPDVPIASAPCNPAVGGVGKAQVVRELDALGGIMPYLADMSGIQFRTLNESKGYAVQSTRIQIDKEYYSEIAELAVESNSSITVIRDLVNNISKLENGLFQVKTNSGNHYKCSKIIVTTGTFLNGKLHTGPSVLAGGRVDCSASVGMSSLFNEVRTLGKRFKTGTPPRLSKKTLNFKKFEEQKSDNESIVFSYKHNESFRNLKQLSCHLTRTNSDTLGIIRDNKDKSPMFNGQINGVGPRYCPSIEDKAFRYVEKNDHHVFVEPEGINLDSIYPNGISTSLPKEIQLDFIRTIPGFEKAEILTHGYAVEYDVVDTSKLNQTLEYIDIPGLYFAGQVNGTSGYEEAAGQGFVAGLNAALSYLGRDSFILDRVDSYIGVMVDDLVSSVRDEPYRLFTSRSENRLHLREDNSYTRMAPYRKSLNLGTSLDLFLSKHELEMSLLTKYVDTKKYKMDTSTKKHFERNGYGLVEDGLSLKELLKRSILDPVATLERELVYSGINYSKRAVREVAITAKYSGYIDRSKIEMDRLRRFQKKTINWKQLLTSDNVSFECKQRIKELKPETFHQLQNIDGIRPATLAYVAGNIA